MVTALHVGCLLCYLDSEYFCHCLTEIAYNQALRLHHSHLLVWLACVISNLPLVTSPDNIHVIVTQMHEMLRPECMQEIVSLTRQRIDSETMWHLDKYLVVMSLLRINVFSQMANFLSQQPHTAGSLRNYVYSHSVRDLGIHLSIFLKLFCCFFSIQRMVSILNFGQ